MLTEDVKGKAEDMALTTPQNDIVPLDQVTTVNAIMEAESKKELEKQLELFNLSQTKKNVLRLTRLNGLLNQADEQLINRLEKRPDQLTTKDILDIMNVVSGQVERLNEFNDKFVEETKPSITAVQHNKTEVNINMTPNLTRDEKGEVMDAVASLLKQLNKAKKPQKDVVLYPREEPQELVENPDYNTLNSENEEE